MKSEAIVALPVERAPAAIGYWQQVVARLFKNRTFLCAFAVLSAPVILAVFAPLIAPFDPYQQDMLARMKSFGYEGHWLGTDELGRDVLSRLIYGARISLITALVPVLVASLIGGSLGIIAGIVGSKVNSLIMRCMDVFYAFPSVLLAVAISGAMGGGLANGIAALSLIFIPPMCRVAETVASQLRGLDYMDAARGAGASTFLIITYHVLRNVVSPILVYASSLVGASIVLASGLSFLGLGVQPPTADWGLMLSSLRQSIYIQPWVCAMPGVAIVLTAMCFNFVSDGVRDALDVKS
ncbi:peptide/nickel transport system permease protein [Variovorax sp. YR266]|uniref:ABC transporter permease n=1 Tax=Variovorax sp. YR266 TaxID=1884386 RepID=UPI000896833F|nr:ABC transporter permease [Variovorax sp. YR266]SDY33554.1 peptide/nickel transport system permease protein [Variovorax sp. YR266]